MMEADLRALLIGDGDLSALVGDRVTWGERDQGEALPGIVLNVISDSPDYHLKGKGGVDETRVQADVWAESYTQARAVRAAVIAACGGPTPGSRAGSIQGIFISGRRDLTDRNRPDAVFLLSTDLMVHHS